jgi:hypothetical protein
MATIRRKSLAEVREMRKKYHGGIFVEPQKGATYNTDKFAVYGYYPYPESSVLFGSEARCYIAGGFATEAEALSCFPGSTKSDFHLIGIDDIMPRFGRPAHLSECEEPYDEDDY